MKAGQLIEALVGTTPVVDGPDNPDVEAKPLSLSPVNLTVTQAQAFAIDNAIIDRKKALAKRLLSAREDEKVAIRREQQDLQDVQSLVQDTRFPAYES
jgi:hypothetical protein